MTTKKATAPKPEAMDLATIGTSLSLETLLENLQGFADGVMRQLEAVDDETRAAAKAETNIALAEALANDITKRDQLIELRGAIEERALRIRKTVQNAEKMARHYEALVKAMDSSVELFMVEQQINEIAGQLHRFKVMKQPDQLQITQEVLVPMTYRKFPLEWRMAEALKAAKSAIETLLKMTQSEFSLNVSSYPVIQQIDKVLLEVGPEASAGTPDKDKIMVDLQAEKEIPGCFILRGRVRLDVK